MGDPATYPDVPQGHWSYEALNRLSQTGIIEGLPNGHFGGQQQVTRYELATTLARITQRVPVCRLAQRTLTRSQAGTLIATTCGVQLKRPTRPYQDAIIPQVKVPEEQEAFPDVPPRHWAHTACQAMALGGIVEGIPDGTYAGDQPVTRYACAVAVARLMPAIQPPPQHAGQLTPLYRDVPSTHWAARAVSRLNVSGILEGYDDGSFHGQQAMTRYELTVVLSRLFSIIL